MTGSSSPSITPSVAPAAVATTKLGFTVLHAILLKPSPAKDRLPVLSCEIRVQVLPALSERKIPKPVVGIAGTVRLPRAHQDHAFGGVLTRQFKMLKSMNHGLPGRRERITAVTSSNSIGHV